LDIQYNKDDLITKIEQVILLLFRVNNPFHQTLISNLFSIVLKSEKKKPAPNWRLVNDFCNSINPEMLSHDCSTIQVKRKGQTKDMELASDFENWYAYKTKALVKLGEWDECFKKSKEALEKIESFHYSNDIWFSRRIAISKKNLGNTEDAISELETILRKKSEWFIQKEVAELYFDKDDLEHAFRYAIDAINNFGPMEFKVDLLFLLGKILLKKEENDLAFKHFTLSKLLREVEDWKVPQKVKDELKNFTNPEINIDNIETLKEMLSVFNNETEFGKLYISYPMIEAYRDLKDGNCQSFRNDCYVYKENFKSYKKDTANNIYTNINKLDYPMWCEIISNYINRIACLFTIKELDRNKFINEITSHTIFNKEKELFTKKGLVFVISALPQFLIDYSKAFWDASLKKRKKT
jgi:tetratricopeptide (TPR) repeat protein